MHVISRPKLEEFWEKHKDSEVPLKIWYKKVRQAQWKGITDLKVEFSTADYVGNNRVVFNIKGNRYRLIVVVYFDGQKVFIRFVGTHVEYDRINAKEI